MKHRSTISFSTCLAAAALLLDSAAFPREQESAAQITLAARPPVTSDDRRSSDQPQPPILRYDRNHDGKVARSEVPARLSGVFKRIDADGDGVIDENEAWWEFNRYRAEARPERDEARDGSDSRFEPTKTGLLRHEQGAFEGYTLFAPLRSTTTYLIDMLGNVVHKWESDSPPGQAVYLLENGNLLRCAHVRDNQTFGGGGTGGKIQEFDWDGKVVWEFLYSDDEHCQHHDIEPLPNGDVLLIAWERKSEAETTAAGRDPELSGCGELWPDHVIEVRPMRPIDGTIIWEWHAWDHLIQDHDPTKANFGVVADHPELIDINFDRSRVRLSSEERERLEALGYIVPSNRPRPRHGNADWNHTNAIAYNADFDQIALSVHGFSEIWVIDHSTTSAQAAGHTGGRSGKGGDILYRWGNPQAYRAGGAEDQQLFAQHDARWIARGCKGAGDLLVFNNGRGRLDGEYSSVDEIDPPVDDNGQYERRAGAAFGPTAPAWVYTAAEKGDFFSAHISGAQRLPNGNTLICSGERGRLFEVDSNDRIVWEYINPFGGDVHMGPPGRRPHFPPGRERDPRSGPHPNMGPDEMIGRPPGRPPGRGPGPGGDHGNSVFRATRLAPDYPGLADKELKPTSP